MPSENDLPPTQPSGRRRPSAVIDVKATEIKSDTSDPPHSSASPASENRSSHISEDPEGAMHPQRPEQRSFLQSYLSAGISGVLGAALVLGGFWLTGAFSPPPSPALPDVTPRFAAIEQRLAEVSSRPPPPPAADPKSLEDVAARLSRIETTIAAPRTPVTDPVVLSRLTSVENAVKSQADNLAALARRIDSLDGALREITGRTEKIAALLNDVQGRLREAGAGIDRAARLAATTAILHNAVERGGPYIAELSLVKPLTSDTAAIAALEPFASTGVPNPTILGQELIAIVQPMLRRVGEAPRDGSYLERLQAGASKLVRVTPAGETRSDEHVATLSRIEQRAARGDISSALTELPKLSSDVRASSQNQIDAWIVKAQARQKAIEASQRLVIEAIMALKTSP